MHYFSRKEDIQRLFLESLEKEAAREYSETSSSGSLIEGIEHAAVGLCLRKSENEAGELEFLLARRADHLSHHPSQVCLPGGRAEKSDSTLLNTLSREFEEEVGIAQDAIDWLPSPWDACRSLHGSWVFPFLGFLREGAENGVLKIDTTELQRAEWLPLPKLFDESLWSTERLQRDKQEFTLPIWNGWDERTWGLTASLLAIFVRRISGRWPS